MEGASPDEDFEKLSIEERIKHKNWKARLSGYNALSSHFTSLTPSLTPSSDPSLTQYINNPSLLVLLTKEANAVAHESALATLNAFISVVGSRGLKAVRESGGVIEGIVEKGVGSTRAGTKKRAIECLEGWVECEGEEGAKAVYEVLGGDTGVGNKGPKVVAGCVAAMERIFKQFGPKIVPPKLLLKSVPRAFSHNDKTVRAEGVTLVLTLYTFLGPTLPSTLATLEPPLKPIQLTELNAKFEEMDGKGEGKGTGKQERLTRAQMRDKIVKEAEGQLEGNAEPDADGSGGGEAEVDPMDFVEAKPILNRLPAEFWEKLRSSKWKERKEEALEPLLEILNNSPKIDGGEDLGNLVKELGTKVEKDSNVVCVTLAAQCITGIAKGLKSTGGFGKYKEGCFKGLLERTKEKKASVLEALGAALDAVFEGTSLPDLLEEALPYLGHKTPSVKISSQQFLSRCLKTTQIPPPKPLLSPFASAVTSNLGDSNPDVREAGAELFACLLKVVGENNVKKEWDELDELRKAKVTEWKEKVVVKYKPKPDLKALGIIGGSGGGGPPKKAPVKKAPAPVKSSPKAQMEDDEPPPPPPKVVKKAPAKKPVGSNSAASAAPMKKAAPPAAAKAPPPAKAREPENIKFKMSQEDGEARAETELPSEILAGLAEGAWKLRLEAMDNLVQWLEGEGANVEAEVTTRLLRKKPGWKESNFQVYAKMAAAFQAIAQNNPTFSKAVGSIMIPPMVDKLGDIKLKKPCGEVLSVISEKTSLQFVLSQAYEPIATQKAPKAQADAFAWIEMALMDFGIVGLSIRDLIECLKGGLKSSNAAVRSSATRALVTLKLFVGSDIMNFVQDLNPQLLTTIQSEFAKVDGAPAPEPIKVSIDNVAAASSGGGARGGGGGGGKIADPLDELFPRVDIEKLISSSNISACNDSNWKIRKEALENIQSILEANKRLKPSFSDLSTALKLRMNDSNKVVQGLALDVLARVASGMNEPFQKYAKSFVVPVCAVLADQKTSTRAAGANTLTAMADNAGLDCMVAALGQALEVQNPVERKEILTWLEPRLSNSEAIANLDLTPLGGPIISCLEDRNSEVRKAAQAVLPTIISKAGYSYIMDLTSSLKPASRSAVVPLIDAARGNAVESLPPASNRASVAPAKARTLSVKPTSKASTAPPSPRPTSPEVERPASRAATTTGRKMLVRPSKIAPPTTPAKSSFVPPPVIENDAPLFSADPKFKASRKLKETGPLKWNVEGGVRPEQIDYLQSQASPHLSTSLLTLLFSKGHSADKDYLAGIAMLDDALVDPTACEKYDVSWEEMRARFFANSDIVLKYISIRFTDTSTTIAIKCIELLEHFLAVASEEQYNFSDYEAQILLGALVSKVGDGKETIRQRIRELFHGVCRLYPFSKVFSFLQDVGLKSKIAKTRSECAEELADMLQQNGMSCCHYPHKAFPALATLIADRDPATRNAALNALSQAYSLVDEELFSYIGKLPEKEQTMLDERLKRSTAQTSPIKSQPPSQVPMVASSRPESRTGLRKSTGIARLPTSTKKRPSSVMIPNGESITSALQEANSNTSRLPSRPPSSITRLGTKTGFGMRPQSMYQATPVTKAREPSPVEEEQAREVQSSSQDTEAENAITEILSNDPNRSTEALKVIQKMIASTPDILRPASAQLMDAVTAQMSLAFEGLDGSTSQSTLRLCKHLMQTLSTFFDHKSLARSVDRPSLSRLLAELTKRLLETADNSSSESIMSLSKVLNMVLIRIFHHSDQSTCFGALFSVLRTTTIDLRELKGTALDRRSKYAELVMKCLWKVSKTVKESLESEALNPKVLLLDIDEFLQVIPPAEWRRRGADSVPLGDMPLRTVKTILQQVVSVMGESVYDELSLIDSPENSFVYQYLFRLLNNSKTNPSGAQDARSESSSLPARATMDNARFSSIYTNNPPALPNGGAPVTATTSPTANAPTPNPEIEINHRLKEIFDKIGSPTESQQGVAELYQLQKKYPQTEARINQWMSNTGHYFQSYIRRALDNLKNEDEASGTASSSPTPSPRRSTISTRPTSTVPSSTSSSPPQRSKSPPAAMGEDARLQQLHQLFGFGADKARRPPIASMNGHARVESASRIASLSEKMKTNGPNRQSTG